MVVMFILQMRKQKLTELRIYSQVTKPKKSQAGINSQVYVIWPFNLHLKIEVYYLGR